MEQENIIVANEVELAPTVESVEEVAVEEAIETGEYVAPLSESIVDGEPAPEAPAQPEEVTA